MLAFVSVLRRLAIAALALLAACDHAAGPILGENVQSNIAPPDLAPVSIEPPIIEQVVVTNSVILGKPSNAAATQHDDYQQAPGVADILWVVDTTGSMADERYSLAKNFQHFVDTLVAAKTDFQIAVTTTDMSSSGATGTQGTLVAQNVGDVSDSSQFLACKPVVSACSTVTTRTAIITNSTPNPACVFQINTCFPNSRKRWEQSLRAMATAIQPGKNPGFIRPRAALAVISLTNSDDDSFGSVAHYARLLRSAKGPGWENFTSFSAIAGTLPDGCYPPGEETYYGSKADPPVRLADLVHRTSGVLASICDPAFDKSLTTIAQALNTLRRVFPLSLKPDPATLSVTVDAAPVAQDPVSGWQYRADLNAIEFPGDYVPPPGSYLQIYYAIAATPDAGP